MSRKGIIILVIMGVMLLVTGGCRSLTIGSTDGMKAFLHDTAKAEIVGLGLREKYQDPNTPEYKKAEKLYNKAAGASNGWLQGLIFDAEVNGEFDVPVEAYRSSEVSKCINSLLEEGIRSGVMEYKAARFLPEGLTAAFISSMVDKVIAEHNKQVEAAIRRIKEQLSKGSWTVYSGLSEEYLAKKYGSSP